MSLLICLFLAVPLNAVPEAGQRVTLKVHDHCSVALNRGKVACVVILDGDGTEPKQHPGGNEWDFWFEVSGKMRYLNPQNQTMFANAGTSEVRKVGCQKAAYKPGRLRIDTLPAGFHVCARSGQGQYGLTLGNGTNLPDEPLSLTYILWE